MTNNNPPAGNYIATKQVSNLLYIAGQTAKYEGKLKFTGKVGVDHGVDTAYAAAKLCALNMINHVKATLKSLDRVKSCIKLTVYINSADHFTEHAKVANGASDLIIKIFKEKGQHVRSAIGCNSLPSDSLIAVDAIFEIDDA